jgi:tetratricopeptide (TPR) repeat protein
VNANLHKLIGLSAAVLLASSLTTGAGTKRPHELVRQARKHHDTYTRNAGPDRQEALHLYQLALEAEPNHDQRFNILYAMARLVSTPPKGQEPTQADLRKAIELYTEIADSCPRFFVKPSKASHLGWLFLRSERRFPATPLCGLFRHSNKTS